MTLPSIVEVSVQTAEKRRWSFLNAYGNVIGLGNRIEDFHAKSRDGTDVAVQNVAPGEFRTDIDVSDCSFKVRLQPANSLSVTHVSWLAADYGVLMLADLLPKSDSSQILVAVTAPAGWTTETMLPVQSSQFVVDDPENSVIFLGASLKKSNRNVDGINLQIMQSGNWPFNQSKILDVGSQVMRRYLALTGFRPRESVSVVIAPLPFSASATKWKAETRGSTVVLAIDTRAKFSTWPGQLGVIFTHELLHLWVPNSLKLNGDYDWFFEGFTLYQALLTAFDLKLINSREFLDTIARVYDSYLSYPDSRSLLEESERRWTTNGSLVYDKGMLLAFMYDLKLRRESNQTQRYSDLYWRLFDLFAGKQADANQAIMQLLNSIDGMHEFGATFIEGTTPLHLEIYLAEFGLDLNTNGERSSMRVKPQLTNDQKRLLHSFGLAD